MLIHPIYQELPQEAAQEAEGQTTAYDSTWALQQIPEMGPIGSEKIMLLEDKLYVVLAVVLVIWAGIAYYLFQDGPQADFSGKSHCGTI